MDKTVSNFNGNYYMGIQSENFYIYLNLLDLFYINTFYKHINKYNKWKNPYLRQLRRELEPATAHTIARRLNHSATRASCDTMTKED